MFRVWNGVVESGVQPLAGAEVRWSADGGKQEVLCELVFVQPAGKETSAVNAPAVGGTGVRGVLAELMAAKESLRASDGTEGQELGEGRGMDEETRDHTAGAQSGGSGVRGQESGVRGQESHGDASRSGSRGSLTAAGTGAAGTVAPVAQAAPVGGTDAVTGSEMAALLAEGSALLTAQKVSVLDARLAGSGLPMALQESVRDMLAPGWKLADLDRLIEVQRACGRRWRRSGRCRAMTRRVTGACAG